MSSTVAILGTPGFVQDPDRFDDETILKVLGANSGNLMFQYAANKLIGGEKRFIGLSGIAYNEPSALKDAKYLIVPVANHLRLNADWTGFCNFLEKSNKPLIILGLGAQSPKIGGEQDTIDSLKRNSHLIRLTDIIRERAELVTVRGAYSQTVCAEFRIEDVLVLGCPSALLNPALNAGVKIEEKISHLKKRENLPLFCLTAAAPFEIVQDAAKREPERKIFEWLREHDGLYVQQSGGIDAIRAASVYHSKITEKNKSSIQWVLQPTSNPDEFWRFMEKNGRMYTSAPDWIDEISRIDLSMGTRLHGNMAAIAGGTPGVVIAHDSRTGELAETMHLPSTSIDSVMKAESFSEILDSIEFDGQLFDSWRLNTAKIMLENLKRLDITASDHLLGLC